jgi:hypothetical protein
MVRSRAVSRCPEVWGADAQAGKIAARHRDSSRSSPVVKLIVTPKGA